MTTFGDNEAQVQYWNASAGEKWVRHQAFMDQQLEVVTDLLLQVAAPRAGEAVLDVGCGTGATLLRLATAVGKDGNVFGCDVSAPMLALARQRIAAAGVRNVDLVQADAQTYNFAENAFDALVSRFGVMFCFVGIHEARVAGHIGAKDCREPSLQEWGRLVHAGPNGLGIPSASGA